MEWTNEKVINLIDLYRNRPVLWDCRLKKYKDRNKKTDALMEIAVNFGIDKEEVGRKIKNLVSHFLRELKKERETSKSGAGSDCLYKSKWFCYDSMAFLKDRNNPRGMTDTDTQDQKTSEDEKVIQEEIQNVDQDEEPFEYSGNSFIPRENPGTSGSISEAGEKKRKNTFKLRSQKRKSSATEEALAIMKEIQGRKSALPDQYTAFGEQVGMRIRDLPSSHAKKIVKHLISTTLFEAEMGKYDHPNSFLTTHSQFNYNVPHFPFYFASVPQSIPSSSPNPPQPSYSGQMPATNQPQQSVINPTGSYGGHDSDSVDSILMKI